MVAPAEPVPERRKIIRDPSSNTKRSPCMTNACLVTLRHSLKLPSARSQLVIMIWFPLAGCCSGPGSVESTAQAGQHEAPSL